MAKSRKLTITLPTELAEELDGLARERETSVEELVLEAIDLLIAAEDPELAEAMEEMLDELEAGLEGVPEDQVAEWLEALRKDPNAPPPKKP